MLHVLTLVKEIAIFNWQQIKDQNIACLNTFNEPDGLFMMCLVESF
jgi:hypothetical protein